MYGNLDKNHKDEFTLAPFTVITDPERLRMIMPEKADIHLPEELKFLLAAQLKEADCVVLNKIDLMTDEEVDRYAKFLEGKRVRVSRYLRFPQRRRRAWNHWWITS